MAQRPAEAVITLSSPCPARSCLSAQDQTQPTAKSFVPRLLARPLNRGSSDTGDTVTSGGWRVQLQQKSRYMHRATKPGMVQNCSSLKQGPVQAGLEQDTRRGLLGSRLGEGRAVALTEFIRELLVGFRDSWCHGSSDGTAASHPLPCPVPPAILRPCGARGGGSQPGFGTMSRSVSASNGR